MNKQPINNETNDKKLSKWGFIIFLILIVIYLILVLSSGGNIIANIVGILLLGTLFYFRKYIISKGILWIVGISIFILLILIILFSLITNSNDNTNNNLSDQNDNYINEENNTNNSSNVENLQDTIFYVQNINRSLYFSQTTPIPFEKTSISLFGEISISIQDATWPNNIEINAINKITVKNIDIISKPKYGDANIILVDGYYPNSQEQRDQAIAPNKYNLKIYDVYEEDYSKRNYYINEHQNGYINIFYAVYDIIVLEMNNVDPGEQLQNKISQMGITQNDLKGTISFDVEIETKDGRIFNKHFEEKMLNGDLKMEMYVGTTIESENYKDKPNETAFNN